MRCEGLNEGWEDGGGGEVVCAVGEHDVVVFDVMAIERGFCFGEKLF